MSRTLYLRKLPFGKWIGYFAQCPKPILRRCASFMSVLLDLSQALGRRAVLLLLRFRTRTYRKVRRLNPHLLQISFVIARYSTQISHRFTLDLLSLDKVCALTKMAAHFLYSQLFVTPQFPDYDFSGQTVIVTGANIGLGFEASRHYVRLGASKVVLAVRSLEKGEEARRSIEQSTGRKNVLQVWQLDLGDYESVKRFASRLNGLDRLDVLVENASIAMSDFKLLEDNESSITVNVVGTFLLALLAIPKLRETASKFKVIPRLSVVSSGLQATAGFKERSADDIFAALNDKAKANMNDRYSSFHQYHENSGSQA